jgi:hypothetical protein
LLFELPDTPAKTIRDYSWVWWLMHVILATWKVDIRRTEV